eukprot:403368416
MMVDLLSGPVSIYSDTRYDKDQLETAISDNLDNLRQKYKQSLKNLEGYFADLLKISFEYRSNIVLHLQMVFSKWHIWKSLFKELKNLFFPVSIVEGKKKHEIQSLIRDSGILQSAQNAVVEVLDQILASKGNQMYTNLLKKVHYSQLINMDFKFAITTADSMIMNNGKCFIHLKLDLLNEQNQREAVYTELTLEQFYQFFHELKRAHSLMEVVS